jgi:hypothetical protein
MWRPVHRHAWEAAVNTRRTRRSGSLGHAATGWPWQRADRPRRGTGAGVGAGDDLIDRTPLGLLQRRVQRRLTDRLLDHRDEAGFFTLTQFGAIALGTAMIVTLMAFVAHAYNGSGHIMGRTEAYSGSTNYINLVESDIAKASDVLIAQPNLLVLDRQSKDPTGSVSHTLTEYALANQPAPAGMYPAGSTAPAGYVYGIRRSVCGPGCIIDTSATDDGVTSSANASKTVSKWVATDLALTASGSPAALFTYGNGKATLADYTTVAAADQPTYASGVKVVYPHYAAYTSTKPLGATATIASLLATAGAIQTADGSQAVSTGSDVTSGGMPPVRSNIFHIFDDFKYLGDDMTLAAAGSTIGIPEVRVGVPNASWIDMDSTSGPASGWTRHSAGDGQTLGGTYAATSAAIGTSPTVVVDTGSSDYTIQVAPEQYPAGSPSAPADGEAAYVHYVDPDNWIRARLVDTRTSTKVVSGGTASAQTVAWQARGANFYFTALRDTWYKKYSDGNKCFFNPQSSGSNYVSKKNATAALGMIVGGADTYHSGIEPGCGDGGTDNGGSGRMSDLVNGDALARCYPLCRFHAATSAAAGGKANSWASGMNNPYNAGSVSASYGFPSINSSDNIGQSVQSSPTCRPKTGNCLAVAQGDGVSDYSGSDCASAANGCAAPPYDSYSSGGHYHLPPGRGPINPYDAAITTQTTTNQVTNTSDPNANCPQPTGMYGPCTVTLTYSTTYKDSWSMIVERDINGSISTMSTLYLGVTPPVRFGFTTSGNLVLIKTWNSLGAASTRALVSDSRTDTATMAGIGYAGGNSPDRANIESVDISNGS